MWEVVMDIQNTVSLFANAKIYMLLSLIRHRRRERNRVWPNSTTLGKERETNRYRTREANRDLGIIFHSRFGTPSQSSPKVGVVIFGPSSISAAGLTRPFFSCFQSHVTFNGFSVWVFFPANQNPLADFSWYISVFNLGVCCYYDLKFENLRFNFLFISPLSSPPPLSHSFSFSLSLSLALSLLLPQISLSYMSLLFHCLLVDL